MPDKSAASNEYKRWLDGIGLSAPGGSDYHYDELPGFVNSGILGSFSLDDLDFGEDLTKGRIDFDDEYLLKSPGVLSQAGSGSFGTVHPEPGRAHTDTKERAVKSQSRTDTPKREQGGGYPSAFDAADRIPQKPQKRQMPTSGLSAQESLFAGIMGAVGNMGIEPKFMDGVKNYMDKAPTQRKLRQEERQSARMNPTLREAKSPTAAFKTPELPAPPKSMPAEWTAPTGSGQAGRTAPPGAGAMGRRRARGRRKASPLAFLIILMVLVRLMSFVYQTVIDTTGPEPGGGTVVTPGGGGTIPSEIADQWEDAYEQYLALRESNPVLPFMELTVDDAADYLTDNGWDLMTINKAGEDSYVEAEFEQMNSSATIYIDSTKVTLTFLWYGQNRPSSEISHAWEAILPDDESICPGIAETEMLASPVMVQAIRNYGTESKYGRITEYYTSVGRLFTAVFDNEGSGWDLHLNEESGRRINIGTDNPEHYFDRLEITGPENEKFR